jgi:predicted GNAT family acetyltransferase
MIIHNSTTQRFETTIDGITAFLSYQVCDSGVWDYNHTIVPKELGGRGLGSQLVKFALDYAKSENKKIIASCSFVASYVDKHPEYQDLVA